LQLIFGLQFFFDLILVSHYLVDKRDIEAVTVFKFFG
jgi:hypothetical protein